MNVTYRRRMLQESGGNQVSIEVFQAGQGSGSSRARLPLNLKKLQIFLDLLLGGFCEVYTRITLKPFSILPDIPNVGADCILGRHFYLCQVVFVGLNEIQHIR